MPGEGFAWYWPLLSGRAAARPETTIAPARRRPRYVYVMLKKKRTYFILLLIGLIAFGGYAYQRLYPYQDFQHGEERLLKAFASGAYGAAEVGYYEGTSRKMRYVEVGRDTAKPLIVFVHGSPSSSAFWLNMLRDTSLRNRANLLTVDRPGYGGSGLGRPEISVEKQAAAVAEVIRDKRLRPDQKIVVLGSSYGGTVSARIAMDFPELVDGLLLMSASMAPREEYVYWVSHPTSHWSLRWILPRAIRSASTEKLNHEAQLEAMADRWHRIRAATVILHGTDDWLIYPPNAYYACDRLVNADTLVHHMIDGGQHDLILRVPGKVKGYLRWLLRVTARDA